MTDTDRCSPLIDSSQLSGKKSDMGGEGSLTHSTHPLVIFLHLTHSCLKCHLDLEYNFVIESLFHKKLKESCR